MFIRCLHLAALLRSLSFSLFLLSGIDGGAAPTAMRIVTVDVAPFGTQDAAGNPSGNVFEIGNMILQESGREFENRVVPYARAMAMIESGDADLVIALPNEKLKKNAMPVAPVNNIDIVVIGKAGARIASLEDLHGKTLGMVRSAEYDERLTADRQIQKYFLNNYEQGLKMLLGDRLDAIVGMKEGIFFTLKSRGTPMSMVGEPFVLNRLTAWLYYSGKSYNEEIARDLRNAVMRLQERKAIQRIDDKYFGMK